MTHSADSSLPQLTLRAGARRLLALRRSPWPGALPLLAFSFACAPQLTREEAKEAVDEIQFASQGDALTTHSIELTTDFTLGAGAEAAAEQLRDLLAQQLPCAELTLDATPPTLHIDYGAKSDDCAASSNLALSGRHSVSIARNDATEVVVDHVFSELTNQVLSVDGSATVTWNAKEKTRHVVHSNTFTRLSDGHTAEGTGDRLQQALPGGLAEGFAVDGNRTWSGPRGDWELELTGVQMRWADPVPQAGTFELTTPGGVDVSLSFQRQSETSIQVTAQGPRRSFDFVVRKP